MCKWNYRQVLIMDLLKLNINSTPSPKTIVATTADPGLPAVFSSTYVYLYLQSLVST